MERYWIPAVLSKAGVTMRIDSFVLINLNPKEKRPSNPQ
jgi:hypothetical protein